MFYSPPLPHTSQKKFFIRSRVCFASSAVYTFFYPVSLVIQFPWIDMKRGSTQVVPCHVFTQNRHVLYVLLHVSQTTKKANV